MAGIRSLLTVDLGLPPGVAGIRTQVAQGMSESQVVARTTSDAGPGVVARAAATATATASDTATATANRQRRRPTPVPPLRANPRPRTQPAAPHPRKVQERPFRDRVVHHALCAALEPVFERYAIDDRDESALIRKSLTLRVKSWNF